MGEGRQIADRVPAASVLTKSQLPTRAVPFKPIARERKKLKPEQFANLSGDLPETAIGKVKGALPCALVLGDELFREL